MTPSGDTCRLDFLFGTLATAYKGIMTSLVMKASRMLGTSGFLCTSMHLLTVDRRRP